MFKLFVLGSVALTALSTAAYAQDAIETAERVLEEIVVVGVGETRQVTTLDAAQMDVEVPGTSPIKLVEKLPGVSFSSADPFGAYEWALRINIRGFSQNQLGFTLDGVPLGDMSYGNHNGLHISRALISENLGRVELAQGSGAVDVASSSNLGGALNFFSRDPSETFGGLAALTLGSSETARALVRFETGTIGEVGPRVSVTYMDQGMDKWKGSGQQNQTQLNVKAVQELGQYGSLTGFVNTSQRRENDYQDMSLGMINRLGRDWDNISSNWNLAVQIADIGHNRGETGVTPTNPGAGTVYPSPITTVDDAYFDAAGLRDDTLAGLSYAGDFGAFSVAATAYTHTNEGQGVWFTPYRSSPNANVVGATRDNAPLSVRTTEYDIARTGMTGSLTGRFGAHTVEGGFWFEQNDFEQFRRFYGLNRAAPQRPSLSFQSNPFFSQWGYGFETETQQFFLQDTWQVTPALKINAGFKSLQVEGTVQTLVRNNAAPLAGASTTLSGKIVSEDNFLPQIGATYDVNDQLQAFASYSENMAAFVSAATAGPFASQNATVVSEVNRSLKPETSNVLEGGVRFVTDRFQGVAAVYAVDFDNRILAVSQGAGIVGNAPVLSNVGAVETRGIELAGTYRFDDAWSLFASATLNSSEYADDVRRRDGSVVTATGGKQVVNTPEQLFKTELSYDRGGLFGTVGASYTGDRFFTFTNNGGKVDGYTVVDATLGYRFDAVPYLNGVTVQLNITNLLDEDYIGTLGTNGFVNAGDSQTVMPGAPQQMFVTIRKAF
jgi:iron complex outermembrane receptor protein